MNLSPERFLNLEIYASPHQEKGYFAAQNEKGELVAWGGQLRA